eukprot:5491361-Pleurochrysis_carterae.AAC.2
MQYVCRGLQNHDLGWLDDLTIATGVASKDLLDVKGHCEMVRRVFERLIAAGMTLKPSKSHLLRKELEVLGYIVTLEASFGESAIWQTVKESAWPWKLDAAVETCRYKRAYEAVRESLRMDVMLAHPDLHDPLAEYVVVTDVWPPVRP